MSEVDGASQVPGAGDVLADKYSIVRVIGQGGMGCVVLAKHLLLNQDVAIKFLLPKGAEDPQFVKRFLREAQTAASIKSEHVVRVLDMGVLGDGVPYMVMEYLEGEDLGVRIDSKGPLQVAEAVEFTLQACEALAEAHAAGLAHRDIKPSNLFVTHRSDGSPLVKLLDFGIAKVASSIDSSLTATGAMMGSPSYMSPEQVRDAKTVDGRTDIWSLGATLYELLTGSPPFVGTTFSALCAAIITDTPPPIREQRRDAPPELEEAILRCLEKDPTKRFADVGLLAEVIAPFAGSHGHVSASRTRRVLASTSVDAKTVGAADTRISLNPSPNRVAQPFAQTEVSSTTESGAGRASSPSPPRVNRTQMIAFVALLVAFLVAGVLFITRGITPTAPPTPAAAGVAAEPPTTKPVEVTSPKDLATNTPVVSADVPAVVPATSPIASVGPQGSTTPTGSAVIATTAAPSVLSKPLASPSTPRAGATTVPATNTKKGHANGDPFADQH